MLPLILITNDDGIHAKGIRSLIEIAKPLGEIVVMAPKKPMSSKSHAITTDAPFRIKTLQKEENYWECHIDGTPVDCVKVAMASILQNRQPDLILSGINHGVNASINTIYSGTMAAAIEGSILGINSIGFSLTDFDADADFSQGEEFIRQIIQDVLQNGLPQNVCLNVNIPAAAKADIKGMKVCRQGKAYWTEKAHFREDPYGRDYFWIEGFFHNQDTETDTDTWALENNYISIVPVQHDFTSYPSLQLLKNRVLYA